RGKTRKWKRDRNGAMNDYQKAIELNPLLTEAWYNLGWMKYDQGNYREAIQNFDKAIQINPGYAPAYNVRAWAKEDMGDVTGAQSDQKKYKELTGF
ncbi:MAG: tetratricopeptide repeat protein, partial [Candidatus Aureabacteria bacterium]|nr:tetratricopeptide repeat protein [Candidatus Auribacterota bacterium]